MKGLLALLALIAAIFLSGRLSNRFVLPNACTCQRTYAMIKPDAASQSHDVLADVTRAGFKIVGYERRILPTDKVEEFYAEHRERAFFGDLVEYMTSGDVICLVLEKECAISDWRSLLGPTDALVAKTEAPSSIRAKYGTDKTRNAAHGSDAPETAVREISLMFPSVPTECTA
eukprot:Rmarinus@m.234